MKVYGRYMVEGRTTYRGHLPGTEFVGALDANAERRAIARGSIRLLERVTPAIRPGSYMLPKGWLDE